MFSSALLSAVLFVWLVFFLKLLRDLSQSYGSLLETRQNLSAMLQTRKEVDFERIELEERLKLAEQVVDKGVSAVENVHQTISGISFGILENIPVTSSTSQVVRKVHDETVGGVYTTIRAIGRHVGEVAGDILARDSPSEEIPPVQPPDFEEEK